VFVTISANEITVTDLKLPETIEGLRNSIRRRDWIKAISIVVNVLLIVWISYSQYQASESERRAAELASASSLYLECIYDGRVSQGNGIHGVLPNRIYYLLFDAFVPQLDGQPRYDENQNIYEIRRTFDRCTLVNNGSVELHNIQLSFQVDVFGRAQIEWKTYRVDVVIPHLEATDSTQFAFASAAPQVFYVHAPADAIGQTVLEKTQRPVSLSTSESSSELFRNALFPVKLSKTPWKPGPCQITGHVILHFNHSNRASAIIHLPKGCKGAVWLNNPSNP